MTRSAENQEVLVSIGWLHQVAQKPELAVLVSISRRYQKAPGLGSVIAGEVRKG
jgi:hypothetical protein